ncbi:MAG: aspartate kinase [Candidatus Thalassarchaeaceae archaeon]|nr:aspartate kinase [Candidatus Thalassarchaeaceae archaeon]
MNIHVHKFGGSCLSAIEDIDAVVERVRRSKGRAVVVVSAFNGITDRLIEQIDYRPASSNSAFTASIELEHLERVPEIATSPWAVRFADTLHHLSASLDSHANQSNVEVRTDVLACGERLSSLAIAAALDARGIPSIPAWSEEAGIRLIGRGEDARIDSNLTKNLLEIPIGAVPVITGWYGVTKDGYALLGRGGSDLTATAVAAALDASSVTIWRDVEGVLALSPRWTLPARNLSNLSYTEASELALFSEPMLHPSAVEPLRVPGIPLYLRPLHSPEIDGTIIGPSIRLTEPQVRAVGCLPRLVPLSWSLSNALSLTECVSDAMNTLGRARIRVAGIRAQPGHVRLLVSSRMAARAKRILSEKPSLPTPELGNPLSILCFVGEGIGEDSTIRNQIQSFADASNIHLQFSEDEKRDHAIHATVPAYQTEISLQSLCTALDLLAQ